MGSLAHLEAHQRLLAREVHQLASLGVRLVDSNERGASGLVAYADKNSILFGGVHDDKHQEILQVLGFVKVTLPVRYLVVSLSSKRLPLVFLLPKKLIQFIESVCRTFLWTEGVEVSKKALLSWDKLCQPKAAGGLNLLDMEAWNKKVLKAKQYFEEAGYTEEDVEGMRKFSIKTMYVKIRGEFARVSWRKLVCNNAGLAKWIFTVFLAAHIRLLTKDRLRGWDYVEDTTCALCSTEEETIDHLFFNYPYSSRV
uniref:Reverse transcriptase zinc-binding domain-containing protein n=1 Tax=Nicotiana tabacum TaxID=4097 RepID=A0A1S3XIE6_TOBAC|nr:PREDICTED: uncharacterized protein LOC107765538 [Nicotiana tabacum]